MQSDAEDIKGRVRMGGLIGPAQSEKDWRGKWELSRKIQPASAFLVHNSLTKFLSQN